MVSWQDFRIFGSGNWAGFSSCHVRVRVRLHRSSEWV